LVNDLRLTSLLYALEAERARGYPSGRLFVDGMEMAIAALIVRTYNAFPNRPVLMREGLLPRRLRQVLEFMHANISKQITLDELASSAGLSSSHFSRQFRLSTGTTPHQYLLRLRVEFCKQMLRTSKLSILEVAAAAGFLNQQHFATVFRQIVGVSPSGYRRLL
jgi:AraC family transcriptional regulator